MAPMHEVGLRRLARGWEWQVVTFTRGHMLLRARGTAPMRWMAKMDSARFVRRNRGALTSDGDLSWLNGIDLR